MGKYLDMAFGASLMFLVMFIALSFTGRDIRLIGAVSAAASISLSVLIGAFIDRSRKRARINKRSKAAQFTKGLIYLENRNANERVFDLIKDKYALKKQREEDGCLLFKEGENESIRALSVIRKYKCSPDDILSLWREIRRKGYIASVLFAVPGKMDSEVKALMYKLSSPGIRILEKSEIRLLFRKYGAIEEDMKAEKPVHPIKTIKAYINKKRAFRYLLYALLLIVYYVFTGLKSYFVFGGVLLLFSCLSLFSQSKTEKLF